MTQVERDYDVFEAGNVRLQSNLIFRGARLAYKSFTAVSTPTAPTPYCS